MGLEKTRIGRRAVLTGLGGALAMPAIGRAQGASPFAGKQVRIIVPFPPAGATDVIGRLMADRLGQMWNANIVVENKPGAGGNIGTEQAARAEPDGTTLVVISVGMATNQYLYDKLNYDPVADFAPVSLIAMVPNIMAVGKHVPADTLPAFIAYARANPGKLTYASSGIGTSVHLSGELFQKLAGVRMVHAPYRGAALAIPDIMAGRVELMFDNITSSLPHVQGGNMKCLGITTAKRSPLAPEFAPIADTVPGFDVSSWFALFAPAKTPPALVERINADCRIALAEPALRDKLLTLGSEPIGSTQGELAAHLKAEMTRWGALIREIGIKAGG